MSSSSFGIHKSWILLTLILASVCMLFFASSIAMVYLQVHKDLKSISFPILFYLNTLILIATSILFNRVNTDLINLSQLLKTILFVFSLTMVFLILQGIAWYSLFSQGIWTGTDRMSAFLYFFSGLHFVHVLGGMPFLTIFYFKIKNRSLQNTFLYESEDDIRNFKLLKIYWHFLDFLWIYLILFLAILTHLF